MNYEEAVAYIEETPKFTTKNKLEHTKNACGVLEIRRSSFRLYMWQEQMEREAPVHF